MSGTVTVGSYVDSLGLYGDGHAVVSVDVLRATTTAITAVARGLEVYPVPSLEAAVELAEGLDEPILAGELGGNRPYGFDLDNSPVAVASIEDLSRPLVLLSTSGTRLMAEAAHASAGYVGSLRNVSALARKLVAHPRVAVLGAATRGDFREEDQLCCAWIAARLLDAGHEAADDTTAELVGRWRDAAPGEALEASDSTAFLRRTGRTEDLDFVLAHVDDLDDSFVLEGQRIVMLPSSP